MKHEHTIVAFRTSPEMKKTLKRLANEDQRTLSSFMNVLLNKFIETRNSDQA